jgi:hypothetical protein
MHVWVTLTPRFAGGAPGTDIGFPIFVGRFMGTGTRVGTPIRQRYAPRYSTCLKKKRVKMFVCHLWVYDEKAAGIFTRFKYRGGA